MRTLRVGTRGSQLALWQARFVADRIARTGGPPCELVVIKTSGDRFVDAPLARIGGKRLFVKEIEDALLDRRIDLAVHSAKDLPADLPDGITLAATPPREDPRDVLVLPRPTAQLRLAEELDDTTVADLTAVLGPAPRIGTASVRRLAQLGRLFNGARFDPIRGNLDTRLRKLDQGQYDALVLAAAGLRRLALVDRISAALAIDICVPAPGQGAIAIETRADDAAVQAATEAIGDAATMAAVLAERALVAGLDAGCQAPVGALAIPDHEGGQLRLAAVASSLDGRRVLSHVAHGPLGDPLALGRQVAAALLAAGAGDILEEVRRAQAPVEGSP